MPNTSPIKIIAVFLIPFSSADFASVETVQRTIFSSGVCDAFLNEKLPMPDYTIGVSAGITYGVSYLSRQKRRNLQLLMHYANDRRYMLGEFL